jgi:hypothetical protein
VINSQDLNISNLAPQLLLFTYNVLLCREGLFILNKGISFLNFTFELSYINNTREFHCDNSIHVYSV